MPRRRWWASIIDNWLMDASYIEMHDFEPGIGRARRSHSVSLVPHPSSVIVGDFMWSARGDYGNPDKRGAPITTALKPNHSFASARNLSI